MPAAATAPDSRAAAKIRFGLPAMFMVITLSSGAE
jgi:hypothetical protein